MITEEIRVLYQGLTIEQKVNASSLRVHKDAFRYTVEIGSFNNAWFILDHQISQVISLMESIK